MQSQVRQETAPTLAAIGARARRIIRSPQFRFGIIILLPTLLFYWFFHYKLILEGFRLSVLRYNIQDPAKSLFVGLGNFESVMKHHLFMKSVGNTLSWSLLSFVIVLPLAMIISISLATLERMRQFYQACIFLPYVVSLLAVALLFKMLLDAEVGQVNRFLRDLGLPTSRFLASTSAALPTLVGVASWKRIGFYVILITAGMLNIPEEIYDAALVDGARGWTRFWKITFPLIARTQMLVGILLAIATLQVFTESFVLTEGGPANATYMYNMLLYNEAFMKLRFGPASAAALLQFIVIFAISMFQLKVLEPKWEY